MNRIGAGTFFILGAIVGNPLVVHRCTTENQTVFIKKLRAAGALVEIAGNSVTAYKARKLKATNVQTGPQPALPTDLQSQFMVLLSLAEGVSHVSETMFEKGYGF